MRIFSAMVWSQGGADYTASLFQSTITGVMVHGFEKLFCTCYSQGLFGRVTQTSGSGPHKLITLS